MGAEAQLLAIERRVLRDAAVRDFLDAALALRLALANDDPTIFAKLLAITPPDFHDLLVQAITDAHQAGLASAIGTLGNDELTEAQHARLAVSVPSDATLATARQLTESVAADIAKAQLLAQASVTDQLTVIAPVLGAADRIERTVTRTVVDSGNMAVREVADIAQLKVAWVAEVDACVHCLRYSGETADVGQDFPGGLTYGAKSYHPDPLPQPPLHDRCRCFLELLREQSYADALRREADRSVLRGFSLPSESMGVRIGAAQRLLDNGVNAPKSVQAFARRAIKAGSFPSRGR